MSTNLQVYGGLLIIVVAFSVYFFVPSGPFVVPLALLLGLLGLLIILWPALSKEHRNDDMDWTND